MDGERHRATLAQLVERLIRNQQVAGSSPAGGSINFQRFTTLGLRRKGDAEGDSFQAGCLTEPERHALVDMRGAHFFPVPA